MQMGEETIRTQEAVYSREQPNQKVRPGYLYFVNYY